MEGAEGGHDGDGSGGGEGGFADVPLGVGEGHAVDAPGGADEGVVAGPTVGVGAGFEGVVSDGPVVAVPFFSGEEGVVPVGVDVGVVSEFGSHFGALVVDLSGGDGDADAEFGEQSTSFIVERGFEVGHEADEGGIGGGGGLFGGDGDVSGGEGLAGGDDGPGCAGAEGEVFEVDVGGVAAEVEGEFGDGGVGGGGEAVGDGLPVGGEVGLGGESEGGPAIFEGGEAVEEGAWGGGAGLEGEGVEGAFFEGEVLGVELLVPSSFGFGIGGEAEGACFGGGEGGWGFAAVVVEGPAVGEGMGGGIEEGLAGWGGGGFGPGGAEGFVGLVGFFEPGVPLFEDFGAVGFGGLEEELGAVFVEAVFVEDLDHGDGGVIGAAEFAVGVSVVEVVAAVLPEGFLDGGEEVEEELIADGGVAGADGGEAEFAGDVSADVEVEVGVDAFLGELVEEVVEFFDLGGVEFFGVFVVESGGGVLGFLVVDADGIDGEGREVGGEAVGVGFFREVGAETEVDAPEADGARIGDELVAFALDEAVGAGGLGVEVGEVGEAGAWGVRGDLEGELGRGGEGEDDGEEEGLHDVFWRVGKLDGVGRSFRLRMRGRSHAEPRSRREVDGVWGMLMTW